MPTPGKLLTGAMNIMLAIIIAVGGLLAAPPGAAQADDPANPFVILNSPIASGGRHGSSFSPNAAYMVVAGSPAKVFKRNCGATYAEVASLGGLYNETSWDASFSPDGTYLALALTSNGMCIYKRSGDSFSILPAPDDMPISRYTFAAWSPDGTYLAFTCNDSPKILLYKRSGDTFTRLSFPAWSGTGSYYIRGPSFSPDGTQLAMGLTQSPYIAIYSRSGDTFTRLPDPADLPAGNCTGGVAYSPTGNYLAAAHWNSPFITIYSRSGSTFTKLPNPAGLPPGDGTGVAWSHDSTYLAMVSGREAPILTTYQRSGDTFTRLASPYVVPGEWSQWIRFGYDSVSGADFLAVPYEWGLLLYSLNLIPPCSLTTDAATYVAGTTAQLNGTLGEVGSGRYAGDPAGGYANYGCTLYFDYGLTDSYGSTVSAGKTNGRTGFSHSLTGLSNLTTYHYRARAVTAAGTALGSDMTFTTTAAPPTAVSAVTNTSGTLITVTFSKPMSNPAGKQGDFTYGVDSSYGWPFTAAALNADNTKIDLTVSSGYITYGKTITLSYTQGTVTSTDGGPLQSFTNMAVTNNVPRPPDPPTVVSAATNLAGTAITVTFNKAMANPAGKQAQFKYKINGGSDQSFSAAALNADPSKIDLTCSSANIAFGNTVTLSYSSGTVTAADGGLLASFSGQAVANNMAAPPTFVSAATNEEGTVITITFSKAMASPAGKQGQFYYNIASSGDKNFTAAALNADTAKIDLTCETPIVFGNTVRVSYGPGTVTAADGGKLTNFSAQNVTNNVPVPGPTFVSATTDTAGSNITITFSRDMADPTGKQAQFKYQVNGGADQGFSAAALVVGQASQIRLTRSGAAFTYADTITVSYTRGTVTSQDGGVLASFSARPVTNAMTTPPLFVSAITGEGWFGTALLVTFNKDMSSPTKTQYKFKVNGGAEQSFTNAFIYGGPTLALQYTAGAIAAGDTVTLSYTRGTQQSQDGGVLESFTDRPVSNNMGQAPVFIEAYTSTTLDDTLSVTFNKYMSNPAGKHGQFKYSINGGVPQDFSAASWGTDSHAQLFLTCATPNINYGDTVTVSYIAGDVTAEDGGVLASFSNQPVRNNYLTPPYFVSAQTDADATNICIRFDPHEMAVNTGTKFAQFSYRINGGGLQTFSSAIPSGRLVYLYCSTPNIQPGDTVTVSYTRGNVRSGTNGVLNSFSDQPVTNNRLAPVVTHAASDAAGSTITLTFSKTMSDPAGKQVEFTYKINDGAAQSFSAIAYYNDGMFNDTTKYVLTLGGTPIASGNTVTVSYAGTVTSSNGDPLASFTDRPVLNNIGTPAFVSAATDTSGTIITITFNMDMADPSAVFEHFSYKINGGAPGFARPSLNVRDINKIDLDCSMSGLPAIAFGDTVTVKYVQGDAPNVTAANTNLLDSFADFQPVTNNVPDPSLKAITSFTIPLQVGPTVINEGAHTIAVTMPSGTNLTALVPTITHTGWQVSPASGAANNFTTPRTYTVTAVDTTTQAYVVTVSIVAGPAAKVRVETAADGSGTVVPAQNVPSGSSITVYSISRDANDIFVANVAADAWSLQSITGGVVSGDLVPAGDSKSAVFTGHVPGTAQIRATSGALAATNSGTQTVTPGPATQVRVETAADGSGTLVPAQTIITGSSITAYAITRDAGNYFIANVSAGTWSMQNTTGSVADGDLVPAGDGKSAVFTANGSGSGQIQATSGAATPTPSGTLTVTAGTPTKVQVETAADGSGTLVPAQGLITGTPITIYAITRTAADVFIANVAADSWSLQSVTGGVAAGDLVPAADNMSATFTGHLVGTAQVRASSGALAPTNSGTLTVVAGTASKVRVETAADGSGSVVPAQVVVSGSSITVYSITRDVNDNFIANVAAGTWTLQNKTGGVADGDLVPAPDMRSAVFSGHTPGSAAVRATSGALAATDSGTLTVSASAPTQVQAETAADGSGGLVPPQSIPAGSSITAYAVTRDSSGNFIANISATWSLQSITGGVVSGDLVPAGDGKSAVFTGHVPGTARIRAASGALSTTDSGRLTVTAGPAAKVRVETAADGSGTVVPAQGVGIGSSITMYCITRDAGDNFVANEAATAWSLQNKTGGVADGDLVPAGDMKSAVFTGHIAGTAQARATSGALPATDSGTLTVSAIPAPTVTGANPNSGQQGQTIAAVVITGANLTGASAVGFGAGITVNSFTVNSPTQVTASITIAAGAAPGTRNVSVTTGGGTGTGNNLFTVTVPLPAPTITSVSPTTATPGQSVTVTITGTNLTGATAISFGAGVTVSSLTVNNPTQVTVIISVAPDAAAGTRTISVTTPAGTGTWAGSFTIEQGNNMIGTGTGSASGSGTYGSGTSTSTTTTVTPPVSLPNVKNMSASISTASAAQGEMVEVSTVVTNAGNASGTGMIKVYVNGQEADALSVTLAPGQSRVVKFNVPASEPGVNEVMVNGVSAGSFTVQDNRAADVIFWASSIMVILALVLGVIYAWRRREGYYS